MRRSKNKNLKKNTAAVVCINVGQRRTNVCYDLRSYGYLVKGEDGVVSFWGGYKQRAAPHFLKPCVELNMPKSLL